MRMHLATPYWERNEERQCVLKSEMTSVTVSEGRGGEYIPPCYPRSPSLAPATLPFSTHNPCISILNCNVTPQDCTKLSYSIIHGRRALLTCFPFISFFTCVYGTFISAFSLLSISKTVESRLHIVARSRPNRGAKYGSFRFLFRPNFHKVGLTFNVGKTNESFFSSFFQGCILGQFFSGNLNLTH